MNPYLQGFYWQSKRDPENATWRRCPFWWRRWEVIEHRRGEAVGYAVARNSASPGEFSIPREALVMGVPRSDLLLALEAR